MHQMDLSNTSVLEGLNEKQKEICLSTDNYVLTACPGSGKTRTLVHRLAFLHEKYPESRKLNIAITFTNRAADEMENRLNDMGIESDSIWTGTIHQFCMQYIIRPYAMYSSRLKCGYHIIDEYKKNEYGKQIAEELHIKIQYQKYFENPQILRKYEQIKRDNKEIDFDDILSESLGLLKDNSFVAENIAAIIRSIHVDEYQDTNELQYQIIARIVSKNKTINVLFIGDVNQAIYGNLGGIAKTPEEICNLFNLPFREDCLNGCYRSTQRLIDYYTAYSVQKTDAKSLCAYSESSGHISYDSSLNCNQLPETIANIITETLSSGVAEEQICIAAPQWYSLYSLATDLRRLLPNVRFNAPDITAFKFDPLNPFYILARLSFTAAGQHVRLRKKLATEFISIMTMEYGITFRDGFDNLSLLKAINSIVQKKKFKDGIDCLYTVFSSIMGFSRGYIPSDDAIMDSFKVFIEKAESRIENNNLARDYDSIAKCFDEKKGIVITTIHGTKGEEYDTVIAFELLNGILPHWDYIMKDDLKRQRRDTTNRLLYVLCSRAKKNLYLFSENGRRTKRGYTLTATDELAQYFYIYDS